MIDDDRAGVRPGMRRQLSIGMKKRYSVLIKFDRTGIAPRMLYCAFPKLSLYEIGRLRRVDVILPVAVFVQVLSNNRHASEVIGVDHALVDQRIGSGVNTPKRPGVTKRP